MRTISSMRRVNLSEEAEGLHTFLRNFLLFEFAGFVVLIILVSAGTPATLCALIMIPVVALMGFISYRTFTIKFTTEVIKLVARRVVRSRRERKVVRAVINKGVKSQIKKEAMV